MNEDVVARVPSNKRIRIEEERQEKRVTIEKKRQSNLLKRTRQKKERKLPLAIPPDLSTFAICWVKVRGFKEWPGVIESCVSGNYTIHFFGDYTRSTVKIKAITNFYEGFSLFSNTFETPKLRKAIQEACICLMKDPIQSECLVCQIICFKTRS